MVDVDTSSSSKLLKLSGRAGRRALVGWDRLAWGRPPSGTFNPQSLDDLPEPARRWLTHCIEPGTPLWHGVVLEMHGRIRMGGWHPFRAVQVHSLPRGYIWAARAKFGLATLGGYDCYLDGEAERRWNLFGHVPVRTKTGHDLARSAAGRAAMEAILVPTSLVGPDVTWYPGSTPDSAIAELRIGDQLLRPEITVANDGALVSVSIPRWSRSRGKKWSEDTFGGVVGDESEFDGVRICTTMRIGNHFGTERWTRSQSYRTSITSAIFY